MVVHSIKASPLTAAFGAIIGFMLLLAMPAVLDLGREAYDTLRPVADHWTVTDAQIDGADAVLSGTMVKHRDCVYVPPTLARDAKGRNYQVTSASPTPGKTWDASPYPQQWGPWRVSGGANMRLTFIVVYLCAGNTPTVVELGTWER